MPGAKLRRQTERWLDGRPVVLVGAANAGKVQGLGRLHPI